MKLLWYLAAVGWSSCAVAASGSCRLKARYGPMFAEQATSYGNLQPITPALPPSKLPWSAAPIGSNSTSDDATWHSIWPNGPEHRGNWANGFDINTNTTTTWPNTGKTVRHTFVIAEATLAPDGVPKQMLVVNGQYPGPLITADWGDWLEITVVNNLKVNGTGLHWHGLRQFKTNLNDGAGGVTECPIAPGDSKVYRFQATQYGSTWYHSHFSVQYGDGVVGPIIINGPSSANYDIDMGAIVISDFYPLSAPQEAYFADRKGPPQAKNYLINGQNIAMNNATGKRAEFTLIPGKKHLFRLINTSMDAMFRMSIDGHKIQIIQADFVPIVPYYTNEVSMHLAQRYHIIVEANETPGNYFFRAMANLDCTNIANDGTGTANAVVRYKGAPNPEAVPTSRPTNHTNTCIDEPMTSLVPIVPQSVDPTNFAAVAITKDVNAEVIFDPEFVFQWTLGGTSQVVDWGHPTMAGAAIGNSSFAAPRNVVQINSTDAWTFWIIQNRFFVPHPMHLHGHDFNLLGQGNGIFDPATDMAQLNFANPPRRDVAMLISNGWTVIAFKSDNPGAWLMHCHIAWHASEGLSLQFLERPQDIPSMYQSQVLGEQYQRVCRNFNTYEANATYKQYDSGLKKRDESGMFNFIRMKEDMFSGRKARRNVVRHQL